MLLSPRPANIDVITIDHVRHMKDRAIVCNICHFDSEIQADALRNYPWATWRAPTPSNPNTAGTGGAKLHAVGCDRAARTLAFVLY